MLTLIWSGAVILRIGLGGQSQKSLLTGSTVPLTLSRAGSTTGCPDSVWETKASGWGCSAEGRSQSGVERQLQTQGQQEALHSLLGKDRACWLPGSSGHCPVCHHDRAAYLSGFPARKHLFTGKTATVCCSGWQSLKPIFTSPRQQKSLCSFWGAFCQNMSF